MYNCNKNITFGEPHINTSRGNTINVQDIILDGNVIGMVEEISWYDLTKPMSVTFIIPLMDNISDEWKHHPNFSRDHWNEYNELHFDTLQELVDCLEKHRNNIPIVTE